eukprot:TRINITY_DN10096_c0_g1_i2.p1 TRINITY_DN10096_c0_g1~~TRINITY_DN10096_c0_g1_i2.p1  ORF type:complete len:198 (+),score=15.43 TRINITY_DN10096_c0_g1_i2:75-668(+)
MAAICYVLSPLTPTVNLRKNQGFWCPSNGAPPKKETPPLLKIAVNGATELLRLIAPANKRSNQANFSPTDEPSVCGVDDILAILRSDYERAYFVTGNFTSVIYAENCSFEDPTIKFRGKDLYSRNLELLVPFFDNPSIALQNIEKGVICKTMFVLATWKLRTFLKLPWRPLISIEGTTVYEIDNKFKVRHIQRLFLV